jgi:predicted DNA-binding protein
MKTELLNVILCFRMTKGEEDRVERLAKKVDRSKAGLLRHLFRLGLVAMEKETK